MEVDGSLVTDIKGNSWYGMVCHDQRMEDVRLPKKICNGFFRASGNAAKDLKLPGDKT